MNNIPNLGEYGFVSNQQKKEGSHEKHPVHKVKVDESRKVKSQKEVKKVKRKQSIEETSQDETKTINIRLYLIIGFLLLIFGRIVYFFFRKRRKDLDKKVVRQSNNNFLPPIPLENPSYKMITNPHLKYRNWDNNTNPNF